MHSRTLGALASRALAPPRRPAHTTLCIRTRCDRGGVRERRHRRDVRRVRRRIRPARAASSFLAEGDEQTTRLGVDSGRLGYERTRQPDHKCRIAFRRPASGAKTSTLRFQSLHVGSNLVWHSLYESTTTTLVWQFWHYEKHQVNAKSLCLVSPCVTS